MAHVVRFEEAEQALQRHNQNDRDRHVINHVLVFFDEDLLQTLAGQPGLKRFHAARRHGGRDAHGKKGRVGLDVAHQTHVDGDLRIVN